MGRPTHVLGGAGAIALLLALTGCGSRAPGVSPSVPSVAGTTPAASSWVALHDQEAGVRFSLPHQVEAQSRPAQGIAKRLYQDMVGEISLSVTVVTASVAIPVAYPRTVYDQMVSGLAQEGATDAHLSDVAVASVAKGAALDATLGFTATDGSSNYWRMRAITAGHTLVQFQVLTFSEPGDKQAQKQVDAMFTRLAKTVVLD